MPIHGPVLTSIQEQHAPSPPQPLIPHRVHVACASLIPIATHKTTQKPVKKRKWRRKNWIRTRDLEYLRLHKLQLDVNDLQQQIASLRVTRSLLYTRALNSYDPFDSSYIKTVRQYFTMMHNGFHDTLRPRNYDGADAVNGREYLSAIMDQDMRMGCLPGLDQFITMWRRYTVAFEDLQFSMASARLLPPDPNSYSYNGDEPHHVVVVAESRFECRIGRACIPLVFPHLAANGFLTNRILGHTLRGGGQLTITFDTHSRRVVQFDMALDVVGAVFDVVKNPLLLTAILDGALLTPDCCIGDLSALMLLPPQEQEHDRVKREQPVQVAVASQREKEIEPQAAVPWQMRMDVLLN